MNTTSLYFRLNLLAAGAKVKVNRGLTKSYENLQDGTIACVNYVNDHSWSCLEQHIHKHANMLFKPRTLHHGKNLVQMLSQGNLLNLIPSG